MIRVAIAGASGYTGAELCRILCNHKHIEITAATSRQYAGQKLSEIFPHLREKTNVVCENTPIEKLLEKADVFFTAVPHKAAMDLVPSLLEAGKKVIDLSADFRIKDPEIYEEWYQKHTCRDYINRAVYGLPERYREQIKNTDLVANPGCYPTSIILGLAPLLQHGAIIADSIIADSKSGTSGAGRSAAVASLYCEVADGFRAYKVCAHRHTPEIEQELSLVAGNSLKLSFTPHLLPISRGILSTIYATLKSGFDSEDIDKMYATAYNKEPFVRYLGLGKIPATQYVRGSNFCDIGFSIDKRTNRIIVMSAIDNIGKGASGQAIQNMNLLCGFAEDEGLQGAPFFP